MDGEQSAPVESQSAEVLSAKEQIIAQIKEETAEILKKHTKAMLLEINEKVIPKAIDLATEMIPGNIDNAIALGAKPIVKSAVDSMIGSI